MLAYVYFIFFSFFVGGGGNVIVHNTAASNFCTTYRIRHVHTVFVQNFTILLLKSISLSNYVIISSILNGILVQNVGQWTDSKKAIQLAIPLSGYLTNDYTYTQPRILRCCGTGYWDYHVGVITGGSLLERSQNNRTVAHDEGLSRCPIPLRQIFCD